MKYLLAIVLVLASVAVQAAQVTLQWTPGSVTDRIEGYYVHFGNDSGFYDFTEDAGNVTEYTVENLDHTLPWYFVVQAYRGEEVSGYSNEVNTEEHCDCWSEDAEPGGGGCFIGGTQ